MRQEVRQGDRFGKLVAVERGPDYVRPGKGSEPRWVFECACGQRVTWKLSSVQSSARRGWISCPDCYRAHKAGQKRLPQSDAVRPKLVYVAGPYSGEHAYERQRNISRAWEMGLKVALSGGMPVIPHTNTGHFDGSQPYSFWLEGTLELMRRCDAVIVICPYETSSGTLGEIAEARRLGIPLFVDVDELAEWLGAHATQDAFAGLAVAE